MLALVVQVSEGPLCVGVAVAVTVGVGVEVGPPGVTVGVAVAVGIGVLVGLGSTPPMLAGGSVEPDAFTYSSRIRPSPPAPPKLPFAEAPGPPMARTWPLPSVIEPARR